MIVFGVLGAIPTLDWVQPCLLTSGWTARADALRDLLPPGDLVQRSLRAVRYAAIGPALVVHRMRRWNA